MQSTPTIMSQRKVKNHMLFENIPIRIPKGEESGSSIHSLPNVPSPLPGPTPSILSDEQFQGRRLQGSQICLQGEEDTFFDDRSLENRIIRTLEHAPRPMHLDTPSSIPVTPTNAPHVGMARSSQKKHHFFLPPTNPTIHESTATIAKNQSHQTTMLISKLRLDLRYKDDEILVLKQQANEVQLKMSALEKVNDQLDERCKNVEIHADDQRRKLEATEKNLEAVNNDLQLQQLQLQKAIEGRVTAENETNQLRQQNEYLVAENKQLSEQKQAVEGREDTSVSIDDSIHKKLTAALQEVETLKLSLQKSEQRNIELTEEVALQAESEQIPQSTDEAASIDAQKRHLQHVQEENRGLKGKLADMKLEMEKSQSEKKKLLKEMLVQRAELEQARNHGSAMGAPVSASLTSQEDPIADRLVRIRDAAERASLLKEHQREVFALKAQHARSCEALVARHEQKLEESVNAAKSELLQKHNEAMESLKTDLETRLLSTNRRHKEEVDRLQEDLKDRVKLSDESLAVAMSKLNSTKKKLEREMAKRDRLQCDLNQVQEQLVSQREYLCREHADEIILFKKGWDAERELLLEAIQTEVIQVFDEKRLSASGKRVESPRSVVLDRTGSNRINTTSIEATQGIDSTVSSEQRMANPKVELSFSKVEAELEETEALVRCLLGAAPGSREV